MQHTCSIMYIVYNIQYTLSREYTLCNTVYTVQCTQYTIYHVNHLTLIIMALTPKLPVNTVLLNTKNGHY